MSKSPCDSCTETRRFVQTSGECHGLRHNENKLAACGPYAAWKAKRELAREIVEWWHGELTDLNERDVKAYEAMLRERGLIE